MLLCATVATMAYGGFSPEVLNRTCFVNLPYLCASTVAFRRNLPVNACATSVFLYFCIDLCPSKSPCVNLPIYAIYRPYLPNPIHSNLQAINGSTSKPPDTAQLPSFKAGLPFVEMYPARSRVRVHSDPTIVKGVEQPHHFSTYRHHAMWCFCPTFHRSTGSFLLSWSFCFAFC
jgi:hypothetical protein